MTDEKRKMREEIRNLIVACIALASFGLSIYTLIDNHRARRDSQHPYVGIDDVTVDADGIGESAGGYIAKGKLLVFPGKIHASFRVYGNGPAIIRSYKLECFSYPFKGGEDSHPNLTLLPGATKSFTCSPSLTDKRGMEETQDPQTGRMLSLSKPIWFKMKVEYEDIFRRTEVKDFCFSNLPTWDRVHLRSCGGRTATGQTGALTDGFMRVFAFKVQVTLTS